ncbi:membrane protein [Actinoplanes cyaneus]|uniref:Membrane protein n=1 Tax=Actinoplanes cyaneus TaxID=52696 RepID=A0A919MDM9_9ACTN|nr:hypothetical protein [Actinoplanes cyaneus]MCW2141257.1 hypothetical protein [Actinoplanes cyaneus]GID67326.1 membrane protein [Actinoplanes cyaneus]
MTHTAYARNSSSPWVGLVLFAGIMLLINGGFEVIEGIVMLARDDIAQATADALAIPADFTFWGWMQLILGAITVLAGVGILYGKTWARLVVIVIGVVSVFSNMIMLPAYPFWCSIVIAIDVLCIYAVAAHGRAVRA